MTDSPPFSQIIDEAMEKKMDRTESPAGHGGKAPETERRAADQSDTGPAIRALCRLEHNECDYPDCKCRPALINEYREQARAVFAAAPAMSDEIARLRASNEELLAALQALVRRLDSHFGGNPDTDWREQEQARAAIANAERRA